MFEIDRYNQEIKDAYSNLELQSKLGEVKRYTRFDLKNIFVSQLENGILDKDLTFLKTLFEVDGDLEILKARMKKQADKFRPLEDFFKENTTAPTDNVIELLAIFIDFQPRPYRRWSEEKKVKEIKGDQPSEGTTQTNGNNEIGESNPDTEPKGGEISPPSTPESLQSDNPTKANPFIAIFFTSKNRFLFRTVTVLLLLTGIFTAIYSLTPKQCMCWVTYEYIAVDCDDKTQVNPIIARTDRIDFFKKIMRIDTLNETDIKRVWYSKINHEVEFFTGSGFHPVYTNRSLKAVTPYILEKYAGKNAMANKTVLSLEE